MEGNRESGSRGILDLVGGGGASDSVWFTCMITRCHGRSYSCFCFDSCIDTSYYRHNTNVFYLVFYRYMIFIFPLRCFLDFYYYILYRLIDNVTDGY